MNETNQIIAEKLLGLCWHKSDESIICDKCGEYFGTPIGGRSPNPNYCGDLNFCFQAQTKAIEQFGDGYYFALLNITSGDAKPFTPGMKEIGAMVNAGAADRCAAMRKLLEAEK